jgi:hypothetical protein
MSFERILELLALGPDGRSQYQEREFDELWEKRRSEQFAAVPRPTCCEDIQRYPILFFSVNRGKDDTSKDSGRWQIRVSEGFWYDFHVGDLDSYITGMPDPEYCPFCGTHVPKMVRKDPPPPNICRVTDGGYYCDTCKLRLNECICDPPAAAFEIYIEPPLKTLPNNQPPFERDPDES